MYTTQPSLLERIARSGPNREAWQQFVDLYTPLLFAWTRRLGLTEHDAADMVQDIFAVLVEKGRSGGSVAAPVAKRFLTALAGG